MIISFGCGQNNTGNKKNNLASVINTTIDTFSSLPPEIVDCSCYFSNDSNEFKNGEYIYVNDFAEISFLKINGTMRKFVQTSFRKIDLSHSKAEYQSDGYKMTIEILEVKQSGYETSLKSGTIKLTDKNGKTITRSFYGECGC